MPEGDTIYRTAAVLRQALLDEQILAAESTIIEPARLCDRVLLGVQPRGKHLLLHLDDGSAIHSHMGMTGSWHLYRHGQAWLKPRRQAALRFDTEPAVAVCFLPKTLEWLSPDALRRHHWLRRLGPDILDPDFDSAVVLQRFRVGDSRPLGVAVMDQTIVCGIGNIYKSEGLFLSGLCPFDPVGEFSDEQLIGMLETTRRLMLRNLEGQPRRTRMGRDGSEKWAYGRQGEPCLKCGATIRIERQGELGRTTFWCPNCQASKAAGRAVAPPADTETGNTAPQ